MKKRKARICRHEICSAEFRIEMCLIGERFNNTRRWRLTHLSAALRLKILKWHWPAEQITLKQQAVMLD